MAYISVLAIAMTHNPSSRGINGIGEEIVTETRISNRRLKFTRAEEEVQRSGSS